MEASASFTRLTGPKYLDDTKAGVSEQAKPCSTWQIYKVIQLERLYQGPRENNVQ